MRNEFKIFIRKPEGKSLGGRPRCRWKDYVSMDIRELGWKVVY
jgi:hypothetical protein